MNILLDLDKDYIDYILINIDSINSKWLENVNLQMEMEVKRNFEAVSVVVFVAHLEFS